MEVACPKQRKHAQSVSIMLRWKSMTSKPHWLSTVACSSLSCEEKAPPRPLSTWATSSLHSRRAVNKPPTTVVISDSWSMTRRPSARRWPTQALRPSPVHFSTSATRGATGSRLSDTTTFSSPKRRMSCAAWDSLICRRTQRRSKSLPTRAWRRRDRRRLSRPFSYDSGAHLLAAGQLLFPFELRRLNFAMADYGYRRQFVKRHAIHDFAGEHPNVLCFDRALACRLGRGCFGGHAGHARGHHDNRYQCCVDKNGEPRGHRYLPISKRV